MAADLARARACRRLRHLITGTLLARAHWLDFLRFCGEHSIVIYLAFFLPMATTRTLLLQTGLIHDIGAISLIVTVAGVAGALALWRMRAGAGANFLFERPAAFWIAPKKPQHGAAGGGVIRHRTPWHANRPRRSLHVTESTRRHGRLRTSRCDCTDMLPAKIAAPKAVNPRKNP